MDALMKLGVEPSPSGRGQGEGRRSRQILRPSPYPLPEGASQASLLVFAFLFLFLPTAHAHQQPFTIKVDTQLVVETVVAKDKDGKTIEGLTENDFIVTEDNVPQTISVFEFQKLYDTTAPPRP